MLKDRYCKRCGIPLEDNLAQCPECGLRYINFGEISTTVPEPMVMNFTSGDQEYEIVVKMKQLQQQSDIYSPFGLFGNKAYITNPVERSVSIEFVVLPSNLDSDK